MTGVWAAMQAEVTADLVKEGVSFVIRRRMQKFDPIAGQYLSDPQDFLHFTAFGLLKSAGSGFSSSVYSVAWQKDSMVQRGDKVVLLECSTYSPQLEDEFLLQQEIWKVKGISALAPGGVDILQYVLLRKG